MARSWLQFFPTVWNRSFGFNANKYSDEDDSTTTVSPQQCQKTEASNYQTLQDYNDAVANAASDLEKAQDVLNQTIIVSDVNGTVVEVADSVGPISKES